MASRICLALFAYLALASSEGHSPRLIAARVLPPLVGTTVALDYGTFTGITNETSQIINFRGIRYADPPVGNLRWRPPVSPPSTQLGTVKASDFANACIPTAQSTILSGTSEDCLFGNVFIPMGTSVDALLPIMVWFHGGGFQAGSTHDAPPDMLMHTSVNPMIFVSFEYRLGQFGFLSGSAIKNDGGLNVGLLDQRAALNWVQRYIHLFGGDNSRVTIWGQSAGSGSTMFHLIGNGGDTGGLFHAAMGDSPSLNFMPTFDSAYEEDIFTLFASSAGCGNNGAETLSCLRAAESSSLAQAGSKVLQAHPSTLFVFAPIIDNVFLTERPVEAFKNGHFAHIPVLFGSNTDDGANWSASLPDASANTSMPNATEVTVFNFIQGQYANLSQGALDQAFSELYPLSDFGGSFSLQGQQMYGEARYICSASMIAGAVGSQGGKGYQFHYDNPHLGSDHAFDLMAFFDPPSNANSDDLSLFETMREYWSSFVTTGQPTAKNGLVWQPVSSVTGSPRVLLHPNGLAMEDMSADLIQHCSFWHGLSSEIET